MPSTLTPNVPLNRGWALGENGWRQGAEQNARTLDTLVQARILDKDLTAPPGSPTSGDSYIVGASATGAWTGKDGQIARWGTWTNDDTTSASGWEFYTPKAGWRLYVVDEDCWYRYTGSAWDANLPVGGIGYFGDTAGHFATYSSGGNTALFKNWIKVIGEAAPGTLVFGRVGGTLGSPTAVSGSDLLAQINFSGWNGASFVASVSTYASASESWTGAAQGAAFYIATTTSGTTTLTTRFSVSHDGHWLPFVTNTYDAGSASFKFRSGYFGSNLLLGASDPGGTAILRVAADLTNGSAYFGAFIGVGAQPNSAYVLRIGGTLPSASTTGYAIAVAATVPSGVTTTSASINASVNTAAASFTLATGIVYWVGAPTVGSGSAITNMYGMKVENQGSSAIATSYGIRIEAQSSSTVQSYSLYVAGAASVSYIGGQVMFGSSSTPSTSAGLLLSGTFSGGTNATFVAFYVDATPLSSATGQYDCIRVRPRAAASTTHTVMAGVHIIDIVIGTGIVTTQHGLLIDDQTQGATRFAIKTGLGLVQFGDNLNLVTGKVYQINGVQVLGAPSTGWTAPTATQSKTGFGNGASSTQLEQTLSAVVNALMTHGLLHI